MQFTPLRAALSFALALFTTVAIAQPAERDYLKYRQDKLKEFLKKYEQQPVGPKTAKNPDDLVMTELSKSGFHLPPMANWFNTPLPPSLKEQSAHPGVVLVLDLFHPATAKIIRMAEADFGMLKGIKLSAIIRNNPLDRGSKAAIKELVKLQPEMRFVLADNFSTLHGVDTTMVPSIVLVNPGLQAIMQVNKPEEMSQVRSITQEISSAIDSQGKKAIKPDFRADQRLFRSPESVLFGAEAMVHDKPNDLLYVAESGNNRILVLNNRGDVLRVIGLREAGLRDGKSAEAQFRRPVALALDDQGHNLFIADKDNQAIRLVDLETGTVSTIWTSPIEGMYFPSDLQWASGRLMVSFSDLDNLLLMDKTGKNEVLNIGISGKKKKSSSEQTKLAQIGIQGFLADGNRNFKYTRSSDGAIFEQSGKKTKVLFKPTRRNEAGPTSAFDLVILKGVLYFSDPFSHSIYALKEGKPVRVAGNGLPGFANGKENESQLYFPKGMVVIGMNILIADAGNDIIRIYNSESEELTSLVLSDYDAAVFDKKIPMGPEGVVYAQPIKMKMPGPIELKIELSKGLMIDPFKDNRIELMEEKGLEFSGADFEASLISFLITEKDSTVQLYFELELHLTSIEHAELKFYRSCRVFVPIEWDDEAQVMAKGTISLIDRLLP